MDSVYRSARLVAIVLEDVDLSPDEERLLKLLASGYATGSSSLLILEAVHIWKERNRVPVKELHACPSLIDKIFDCRWTGRAWCYHEYLLIQDHVLLLSGRGGQCFVLQSRTVNFITSCLKERDIIESAISHFGSKSTAFVHKGANVSQSDSTPFVRIWEACNRSCSYLKDLVSIGLNVADINLNFVGTVNSVDDCRWKLACAALCSGDASVLTSEVTSLWLSRTGHRASWLQWPEYVQYTPSYPVLRLPRVTWNSTVASISFDGLTLDIFHLTACPKPPSHECTGRASSFLLRCEQCFPELLLEAAPSTYLQKKLADGSTALECITPTTRNLIPQYLACGLDNGVSWMKTAFSGLGVEDDERFMACKDLAEVAIIDVFDAAAKDSFGEPGRDAICRFLFASLSPYSLITWSDDPRTVSLGPGTNLR